MTYAKTVSIIGLLSMTAVLLYGFIFGNFLQMAASILSNPWGIVSMVDLYVGFFLFTIFIFHKTKKTIRKNLMVYRHDGVWLFHRRIVRFIPPN